MADNLDINVNVNTTNAQRNLANLNKSVQGLEDTFGKLKNAIAGIAIGNIISNINNYALSITQASNATGIAIDTISNFSKAVGAVGGDAQRAVGDIIDFTAELKNAKDGSASAQAELSKIGISLQDLGTLSEQDLFNKTVQGLANIQDASTRTALSVKLLGKNFKDIDVREVAATMSAVGAGANTGAITAAAAAQKELNISLSNLKNSLLEILQPINEVAAEFLKAINGMKEFWSWVTAVGKALLDLALLIGAVRIGLLVIAGIRTAFMGAAAAAEYFGGIIKFVEGVWSALIGGLRNFAGGGGYIAGIKQNFDKLYKMLEGTSPAAIESLKAIQKWAYGISAAVGIGITGALAWWKKWTGETEKAREQKLSVFDKEDADAGAAAMALLKSKTDGVIDANRGLQLELNKTLRAYKQQGEEANKAFKLQTEMMGMSEEQQLVVQETKNLENQYLAQINAMREKYISMQEAARVGTEEEKKAFAAYAAIHFKGMAQMSAQYTEQQAQLKINLDERLKQIAVQKQLIYDAELLTKAFEAQQTVSETVGSIQINAIDKVRQMYNDYQQNTLPGVYGQLRKIADQENEIAIAAKRRASEQFENDPEGLMKALANIDKATKQAITIQQEAAYAIYQNQRTFEYGWAQAFDSYVNDATNAAKQAQTIFSSITSNMERAIDNFVTTGKFSFSDLARSIIQDLIKIELKAQATSILKAIGGTGGSIFSAITSLFGFAEGGNPPINKPSIVGENGPELFVPRTAGTIIPNGGTGAMAGAMMNAPITNNYITNNISAVDAKSVAQLFAENRKTLLGTVRMAEKELPYGNR